MPADNEIRESGTISLTNQQWDEARKRAQILRPLADSETVSRQQADCAAAALGLSRRTVYRLIDAYRRTGGVVPSLVRDRPTGGRGKTRLPYKIESVIDAVIEAQYLCVQKPSLVSTVKEVRRRCRLAGLKPPGLNTVDRRIKRLLPDLVKAKREGRKSAQRLKPAAGRTPPATFPMETIQIDHTKIDVIIVDPTSRAPIGRPFLTVAIDEFSRCIVGICVTLDAPSATSVGLCLSHAVSDKSAWLERLGVEFPWPMRGKPRRIFVDNGREFHSEGLRRGCEAHGIVLDHRPIAQPHYGGIVERVIGTVMRMTHELPGTTFSNIQHKGEYDSETKAALTLAELEKFIAIAIAGRYHKDWHRTLLKPPEAQWQEGLACGANIAVPQSTTVFLVDFLPVVKRRIQRNGFVIDHVAYYSNALSPWIARRDEDRLFVIRTDPRDLSQIWVLDEKQNIYLEVPFRTLSRPPITRWEHRAALVRLREQGHADVDETAIFKAIEKMRTVADEASKKSKAARRNVARRAHLTPRAEQTFTPPPADTIHGVGDEVARPFTDIEEW